VAGEWHNNHHLYPKSARSGFKSHQFDMAWQYIRMMHRLGAVRSYRDDRSSFRAKYTSANNLTAIANEAT
jgi:stearoyl-CoA desaturase (delta-9 desaturase)